MKMLQSTVEKALYVLLLLVFTVGTYFAFSVQQDTKHNHEMLVNNCLLSNDFKQSEKQLWTYILTLPPEKPITAEQQQRIDQFKIFLDKTFAERDCNKL